MTETTQPRSRTIRRRTIAGAVRSWLAGRELDGANLVRAQLALKLASELDAGSAPPYARARLVGELRAVVTELELYGAPRNDHDIARKLLEDVWG